MERGQMKKSQRDLRGHKSKAKQPAQPDIKSQGISRDPSEVLSEPLVYESQQLEVAETPDFSRISLKQAENRDLVGLDEESKRPALENDVENSSSIPTILVTENWTDQLAGLDANFAQEKSDGNSLQLANEDFRESSVDQRNLDQLESERTSNQITRTNSGIGTWYDEEVEAENASEGSKSRSDEQNVEGPSSEHSLYSAEDAIDPIIGAPVEVRPSLDVIQFDEEDRVVIQAPKSEAEAGTISSKYVKVHDFAEVFPIEEPGRPPQPQETESQPILDASPILVSSRSSLIDFSDITKEVDHPPEAKVASSLTDSFIGRASQSSSKESLRFNSLPRFPSTVELLTEESRKRVREANGSNHSSLRQTGRSLEMSQVNSPAYPKELKSENERNKQHALEDLRAAASEINLRVVKAMQKLFSPSEAVLAVGIGLMHVFDLDVPSYDQWEAVQRMFSKPGFIVQKVRGLEAEITSLKVPVASMQKLKEMLSGLTELKVKYHDNSGVAHIVYELLVKALELYQCCLALQTNYKKEPKSLSASMPVSPRPKYASLLSINTSGNSLASSPAKIPKLNLTSKARQSKRSSLQPSHQPANSFKSPKAPKIPREKPDAMEARLSEMTSEEVFNTKDPNLIELFLKKQETGLLNLKASRKKAEWRLTRRHKSDIEKDEAQAESKEIEHAAKLSKLQKELTSKSKLNEAKVKHDALQATAEYLRDHKKEVALRTKPYYSRSSFDTKQSQDLLRKTGYKGQVTEEMLMSAYEDLIQQQERISSMRFAYLEIQERKREESKLLSKF